MKNIYSRICTTPLLLIVLVEGLVAQNLLTDHTDITFSYSAVEGEWETEFRHGGTDDNPNTQTPLDEASLPARDFASDSDGDRFAQPPLGSFDFTGVPDGDPLWILPQTDAGYTWPGFRNDQAPGAFRAYDPGDSRVTSVPQPWVTIRLAGMTYVGTSENPQFSLWQIQNGVVQWMATSDGIDASDLFYLKENAHTHMNFGFSSLGLYRIAFKPSAILDATGETVEGAPKSVTFAIGARATWLASHFTGDALFTESISGVESDSDKDGVRLLLEYAFNLNPVRSDFKILEPFTGTSGLPVARLQPDGENESLQVEYIRRKSSSNPQISYFAEFTDDLNSDVWTVQAVEQVSPINDEWERVIVTDPFNTSESDQRFARVRVELQDTIAY